MQLLARAEQQSKEMFALMKRDFESNESDKSQKIKGKEQTVYTHFFLILVNFHYHLIIKFDSSFSFMCYQKYFLTAKDCNQLLKWLEEM